jgi:biotin carboxyl carrier protein
MIEKSGQLESLFVDDTLYTTVLTTKYKNRKTWTQPDIRKILAFLPGTITDVLVNKGDYVKEGQTVAKFEAMKMINNVQALTAGTVKEIYVKAGDKFPKGFVLMEFE